MRNGTAACQFLGEPALPDCKVNILVIVSLFLVDHGRYWDWCGPHAHLGSSPGAVFSYKLRYSVGFLLVEMAISTNQKPTTYRNLYENTGPGATADITRWPHVVRVSKTLAQHWYNNRSTSRVFWDNFRVLAQQPIKHGILTQCWFIIGPVTQT